MVYFEVGRKNQVLFLFDFFFIILRAFHVHFKKMCHHLWLAVSRVGIFKIELKELYLFINSTYVCY